MGKLTKYIIIMSGLSLLFYFTGLLEQTPNSTLLNLLLDPVSFQNSTLVSKALLAIEGIVAATIVVGIAIAGRIELAVISAFVVFAFNLFWDFVAVFAVVASVNPVIAILIFSPIFLLYTVTILEWWRGVGV